MQVQEHYVQVKESERIQLDSSGWFETWTQNKGDLFRASQKSHGRCIGKMYAEDPCVIPIGWIFEKHVKCENSDSVYLRETWVELKTDPEPSSRN